MTTNPVLPINGRFKFHRFDQLPPYVFAEVTELMLSTRRAGADVIDLGMGNPDLPTPPHIVNKIREVARNPRTHRYSSSRGIPNLRAAICEWYARRYAVDLHPDRESIALIGSKEGLAHFVLKIPDAYARLGSLEFSKRLLQDASVAVSPGIGFGKAGDGHVRFSLIENEHRIRQAVRSIRRLLDRASANPM